MAINARINVKMGYFVIYTKRRINMINQKQCKFEDENII